MFLNGSKKLLLASKMTENIGSGKMHFLSFAGFNYASLYEKCFLNYATKMKRETAFNLTKQKYLFKIKQDLHNWLLDHF